MKIESTPSHSTRLISPKLEHVLEPGQPLMVRDLWEKDALVLEIGFNTKAGREVKITFSKEETDKIILYSLEKSIYELNKKGSQK